MDHGQLRKRKKTTTSSLDHPVEKKEIHVGEALKLWVKWTNYKSSGPRVLDI